jgi:opacity protein-like surface antigen
VGVNLQPREQLYNLNVGNEFAYGLGMDVPFQLGKHRLSTEATLVGAMGLEERDDEECPLELLAAVKYRLTHGLAVHVGGGPGITRGYGTPRFRLFAGLLWTEEGRVLSTRLEPRRRSH